MCISLEEPSAVERIKRWCSSRASKKFTERLGAQRPFICVGGDSAQCRAAASATYPPCICVISPHKPPERTEGGCVN